MIKCEIVNGFPFSIGGNVGRECICLFETVRHFVADPAGWKAFPIMIQGNESAK